MIGRRRVLRQSPGHPTKFSGIRSCLSRSPVLVRSQLVELVQLLNATLRKNSHHYGSRGVILSAKTPFLSHGILIANKLRESVYCLLLLSAQ